VYASLQVDLVYEYFCPGKVVVPGFDPSSRSDVNAIENVPVVAFVFVHVIVPLMDFVLVAFAIIPGNTNDALYFFVGSKSCFPEHAIGKFFTINRTSIIIYTSIKNMLIL